LKNYQAPGALFLGVCNGKLSEGIDFTDEMARMVIVVGVPFPNTKDIGINCKRVYLDQSKREMNKVNPKNQLMNGSRWYFVTALKTSNQAIGRTIRHRNDFGTILLLDSRYSQSQYKKELSSWVGQRVETFNEANDTIIPIKDFFEKAEKHCSQFKSKRTDNSQNFFDKIKQSGKQFTSQREKLRDYNAGKRQYKSMNKEKELKRTMRNNHYELQNLKRKTKAKKKQAVKP
jgi:Fanconi anemia group J protein